MEIFVVRNEFTLKTCIADVRFNDEPRFCYFLNDRDRGLDSDMSLEELYARKVKYETAHTTGRFLVEMDWSGNFKTNVPHVRNVPAFSMIECHVGNNHINTHGCNLPGLTKAVDFVGYSVKATERFVAKLNTARKGEKIWLNVSRDPKAWATFLAKNPLPNV